MSAYKEVRTEFRSIESLTKALKDVGLDVYELSSNVKENSLTLQGYAGRVGENVALRLPKSHYRGYEDTGFAWTPKASLTGRSSVPMTGTATSEKAL